MADIAARSLAISDGWGAGYVPTGTPASPRYTVTKKIADNGNGTGTITLTVILKTNSGYMHGGYQATLNFTVAGVSASKVWKSETTNWNQNSSYSTSIAVTIPLDGATTKTANLWLTVAYYGTAKTPFTFSSSAQGGNEITSIPVGYSVATFTAFSNFTSTASSIAVTVRERTASLKNRMTLKIGSTTIKTWTNLDNVDSLALYAAEHTAIHNAVPNSGSSTATMVMETLNGTTVIGTVTRTATVTIASTIVPTLTSITAAETVSAVSTLLGAGSYSQSLSRIKFTINGAKAGQGATISSYKIVFNGVTWTASTATTGAINKSGAITATGTVTDSRGRSASKTVSVTLLAYSAPALTSVQTRRASTTGGTLSDEGVYLRVDRNASISALGNKNRLTLKIEHKLSSNTTWVQTYSNTWAAGTNSISGNTVPTGYTFSSESTFDIRITVSDKFGSTVATGKISSAKFPLVVGIDGIGVNKVPADGRALDVGGDMSVDGRIQSPNYFLMQGGRGSGLVTTAGWKRIVTLDFTSNKDFVDGRGGLVANIKLYRNYANTSNESWDITFTLAHNNATFSVNGYTII